MKYDLELVLDEDNSLSKIIKQIKKCSIVLEFGPANGRMTKYLKENLQCDVYIVEIEEEAAKSALKYAKDGIVDNIENYAWVERWSDIRFDYIVFADVLEHLYNPQEVLKLTKTLLKDDGQTIISVPNVSHNSVLINQYNNIFNYTPLGLLDNTHIHLFAYNTLKEFCYYAGYVPVIEDATYSNVGDNEVGSHYNQLDSVIQKHFRERKYANVYQFLFTLQKKAYVDTNNVQIERKIIDYFPNYELKVYWDYGSGWTEDLVDIRSLHKPVSGEYSFDVKNSELLKGVRIDPLDVKVIARINLAFEDTKGEQINVSLDEAWTNGDKYGDVFVGLNDDLQVVLNRSNFVDLKRIIINVEYLDYAYGDNSIEVYKRYYGLTEENKSFKIQMEQKNREINERYDNLQKEYQEINERYDNLQKQHQEIIKRYDNLEKKYVEDKMNLDKYENMNLLQFVKYNLKQD
ncbi:MAG: methyltransferase domain-containing protein [Lachnospiraceae bacterium]|nr:methyltransferase domain-containing protein [Lachnospiraceae bacterium]